MEKKFKALRLFGTIYKIIGVIVLILTILGAAGTCIMGFAGGALVQQYAEDITSGTGITAGLVGLMAALGMLIGGAISGLSLYAIGEGIYLLIGIEENTRSTNALLRQQIGQ